MTRDRQRRGARRPDTDNGEAIGVEKGFQPFQVDAVAADIDKRQAAADPRLQRADGGVVPQAGAAQLRLGAEPQGGVGEIAGDDLVAEPEAVLDDQNVERAQLRPQCGGKPVAAGKMSPAPANEAERVADDGMNDAAERAAAGGQGLR